MIFSLPASYQDEICLYDCHPRHYGHMSTAGVASASNSNIQIDNVAAREEGGIRSLRGSSGGTSPSCDAPPCCDFGDAYVRQIDFPASGADSVCTG